MTALVAFAPFADVHYGEPMHNLLRSPEHAAATKARLIAVAKARMAEPAVEAKSVLTMQAPKSRMQMGYNLKPKPKAPPANM